MVEKRPDKPYSWEEIFSFDRLKRAMTTRALNRIEEMWQGNKPISPEQISEVINDEWQKVKEAVRSSPAAREAFRKYLEHTVAEEVNKLVQKGKAELESLGVVERSL